MSIEALETSTIIDELTVHPETVEELVEMAVEEPGRLIELLVADSLKEAPELVVTNHIGERVTFIDGETHTISCRASRHWNGDKEVFQLESPRSRLIENGMIVITADTSNPGDFVVTLKGGGRNHVLKVPVEDELRKYDLLGEVMDEFLRSARLHSGASHQTRENLDLVA